MHFAEPLQGGRFLRRYRRFFMDFMGIDGAEYTAHCPNTGSLLGCQVEGAPVLIQPADNPNRKLRYTWKAIEIDGTWVGVDTSIANGLVAEAITGGVIPSLAGFERMLPEVKYGREGRSRIDLLLSSGGEPEGKGKRALYRGDERVYVEVKNTTLALSGPAGGGAGAESRRAAFPDAVTERGRKHLLELLDVVQQGHRAALVFCVQRDDCADFVPAAHIDPAYTETLKQAVRGGVELYALAARVTASEIALGRALPIDLEAAASV